MSRADEGGGVVTSHGELAAFACGLRKYPAGLRGEGGGTGSPVTERWPRSERSVAAIRRATRR